VTNDRPVKQSEDVRIQELSSYHVMDTITEEDFDNITALAAQICDVPIALISLVDKKRQWFKSRYGLQATETPIEQSFCAHALNTPGEPFVVTDSRKDNRFMNNPLVTGDPNIVFYAGVPLVTNNGFALGTVCIIDTKTRELNDRQIQALKVLSKQTMNLLQLRKTKQDLEQVQLQLEERNKDLEQFAMVVTHDIKSPLASIQLANNMLVDCSENMSEADKLDFLDVTRKSADKIAELVDGILSFYKSNSVAPCININLHEMFSTLSKTISSPKKYKLFFKDDLPEICFNLVQLEQIFLNLVNNAIRYNNADIAEIHLECIKNNGYYNFTVTDNGIGIAAENINKIFDLFSTVQTYDCFGVKGHGIGLPTVKKIIVKAGGTINVHSVVNKGTTFSFTLPAIAGCK